jgi:hypothetical protein
MGSKINPRMKRYTFGDTFIGFEANTQVYFSWRNGGYRKIIPKPELIIVSGEREAVARFVSHMTTSLNIYTQPTKEKLIC